MTTQLPDWNMCERIRDNPDVDEALRALLSDQTGDNATLLVRSILIAQSGEPTNGTS